MVIRYIRVNWKLHLNKTFSVVCEKTQKYIYKKKFSKISTFPFTAIFQDFPTATATAHATRAPHPRRRCVYSDEDIICNLFPDLLEFTSLADDAGDVGVEGGSLATPAVESVKNKMKYEQKQRERETEGKQ